MSGVTSKERCAADQRPQNQHPDRHQEGGGPVFDRPFNDRPQEPVKIPRRDGWFGFGWFDHKAQKQVRINRCGQKDSRPFFC